MVDRVDVVDGRRPVPDVLAYLRAMSLVDPPTLRAEQFRGTGNGYILDAASLVGTDASRSNVTNDIGDRMAFGMAQEMAEAEEITVSNHPGRLRRVGTELDMYDRARGVASNFSVIDAGSTAAEAGLR